MKSIVYVSLLTLSGLGKYLPVLGDGGERVRDHASRLPQEQVEEERLLEMYAVNNATAVEITSKMLSFTEYVTDVTIQFQTGPNLREYDVTTVCVAKGDGCNGVPLGDGAVVSTLPQTLGKEAVEVNITSIDVTDADIDIECFARLDRAGMNKRLCFPVQVPGRPEPCTGPVQATGTAWVFSCGQVTCDETCATIGTSCNAEGMRAVDTEEKGKYVLGLVDQFATFLSGLDQKDAPVIDYYSPFRSEYFWDGSGQDNIDEISTCTSPGLIDVSQRICCCSDNVNECPTG